MKNAANKGRVVLGLHFLAQVIPEVLTIVLPCSVSSVFFFFLDSEAMKSTGAPKEKSGHCQRLQWSNENMEAAMEAVKARRMTSTAAATTFSVPRKTLDDRVKGLVNHGKKPGVSTVLTANEEASLISYLLYMAKRGFLLTKTMVKAFAWAIAKRSGRDGRFHPEFGPGEHWWVLFKKRHPILTLRKSVNLERSRAEALNPEIVEEYFKLLETTLKDNNLLNHREGYIIAMKHVYPLIILGRKQSRDCQRDESSLQPNSRYDRTYQFIVLCFCSWYNPPSYDNLFQVFSRRSISV